LKAAQLADPDFGSVAEILLMFNQLGVKSIFGSTNTFIWHGHGASDFAVQFQSHLQGHATAHTVTGYHRLAQIRTCVPQAILLSLE